MIPLLSQQHSAIDRRSQPDGSLKTEPEEQIVNSWTEWHPLEEVVVGRLTGGVFPEWQTSMRRALPSGSNELLRVRGGTALPESDVAAADEEIQKFVAALVEAGVTVRRPELIDQQAPFATPNWSSRGGMHAGMPRDALLVVGNTIVEAPMSWRCRHYETDAYRTLLKYYFRAGARWLAAPRPQLTNELYRSDEDEGPAVTEFEPVFDAADFLRFGSDVIVQRSHVTNAFGIEWVSRSFAGTARIHEVEVNDPHAMHIDATMLPLAPGKLLVNPTRFVANELFRDWEILKAPESTLPANWPMYFSSPWVNMNLLSLDEGTVVVERHEWPLIAALERWGFVCVPLDFRHVYSFGGSFHCATLDVRRRGVPDTVLNVETT